MEGATLSSHLFFRPKHDFRTNIEWNSPDLTNFDANGLLNMCTYPILIFMKIYWLLIFSYTNRKRRSHLIPLWKPFHLIHNTLYLISITCIWRQDLWCYNSLKYCKLPPPPWPCVLPTGCDWDVWQGSERPTPPQAAHLLCHWTERGGEAWLRDTCWRPRGLSLKAYEANTMVYDCFDPTKAV